MERITLVGFGLLASSIASAVKQANLPVKIRAVSSPSTLDRARQMNLADEFFGYDQTAEWVKDSDIILLCSPILHILKILEDLSKLSFDFVQGDPHSPAKRILVSDIGSTKVDICKAGASLPEPFAFVGGHPMAGSEKRTLEYNDPSIFENAYWFVCPAEGTSEDVYQPLLQLIDFLGAHSVVFPPEHHDRTMAWVSHMPQMLSSTLAANIPERLLNYNYQHYAGRAFRDMTRIAASGWNMWHDIAVTNRGETVRALREVREGLDETIAAMDKLQVVCDGKPATDDCSQELEKVFKAGNEGRASLFAPGRNAASSFAEITIPLKDKPGSLLDVLKPLADAGLNVRDIELMKVRENVSGTLLLAFKTPAEAQSAIRILKILDYDVKDR